MQEDPISLDSPYLEELYERFVSSPESVDSSWRKYFSELEKPVPSFQEGTQPSSDMRILSLIEAYRVSGHLMAKTNPIETREIEEPWELSLEANEFSSDDLNKIFPTGGLLPAREAPLSEIIKKLRALYSSNIGFEFIGSQNPELSKWIQDRIEKNFKIDLSIEQKKEILNYLNKSELFESFLHTKYPGSKRFSLEGGETLIPMLVALIEKGAELGVAEFVLGMAHRGRLNVLSNILNKSYADVFSEFEEDYTPKEFEGSGDVKYHKGYASSFKLSTGKEVDIFLSPNPSHLESVDPVVEGVTRAKQVQHGSLVDSRDRYIPLLIHGDASLAGQGVVYETLQLSQLDGYCTGGTIHIALNNFIGFTTVPDDARSTKYCTDIAKTFGAPIFHVNAEDPEGCIYAMLLALEIRMKFHSDVFIDLNCYRKYGHNETDEPAFTQPLEYKVIRSKKPIREIYRDHLIQQGLLERQIAEALEKDFKEDLKKAHDLSKVQSNEKASDENGSTKEVRTAVDQNTLQQLSERLFYIPDDFKPHKKLEQLYKERYRMVTDPQAKLDWALGELLAYATLLIEGVPIRISGQDCQRGTFSHRHAVIVDQEKEARHCPLQHLSSDQATFDIINSPLSEYSCLGFEYGYNLSYPESLVIWEAQFGDFCNAAQIIIDQYISTGEQKWGHRVPLTLFLPHGYEGQGPEHSSARLERFLTLSGHENWQVVYPTLPAQLFHLLRRQMLTPMRKPLIVLTPKGLLRHPDCISPIIDFTDGKFLTVIDDASNPQTPVKRLAFCTGRLFYDLQKARQEHKSSLAIIRVEQLYPLDTDSLRAILDKYKNFEELVWIQEEPCNMGAWDYIRPQLEAIAGRAISYIGRSRSSSPAAGVHGLHATQHNEIITALFR